MGMARAPAFELFFTVSSFCAEFWVILSYMYRDEQNTWVKGSVCLVLEFALPPFSPPLPSVVEVSRQ